MSKHIKIISVIFVFILALFITGTVIFIKTVNPNDFKDKISKEVFGRTGRILTINGNISWKIFPWLSLKINDVSLSNSKEFAAEDNHFIDIAEADISVKILPLLTRRFQFDNLILKDLNLSLIKNVDGKTNWRDLIDTYSKNKTNIDNKLEISNKESIDSFSIKFTNIEIINAKISWDDRSAGKNIVLRGFNFKGNNVNFNAPFDFNLNFAFYNKTPNVFGSIALQGTAKLNFEKHIFLFTPLKIIGRVQNEKLPSPQPFEITANINANFENQNIAIEKLAIKLADIVINANINGHNIIDAPIFAGDISMNNCKLAPFLHYFFNIDNQPLATRLKFKFQASSKFVKIPNLNVKIDDTEINGNVNFTNFGSKYLSFDFSLNSLDVNRYNYLFNIPKPHLILKNKKHNVLTIATYSSEKPQNRETFLNNLSVDGTAKIGQLKFAKLNASNINLSINGDKGFFDINPISANFYQGILNGKAHINLNAITPKITSTLTATNIAVALLFKDLANLDKITGTANIQVNLNFAKNLTGNGNFEFINGYWNGIDLAYQINLANSIINKKPKPEETNPPKTEFGKWTGTFKINDGIVSNNDLIIQSDRFSATGNGSIDLQNQNINYYLNAKSKDGFSVPIKISGNFSSLKIFPDLGNIAIKVIGKEISKHLKINGDTGEKIIKSLHLEKLLSR